MKRDCHCFITPHGRYHLELKTIFPLSEARRDRYEQSVYLFFPMQLDVSRERLGLRNGLNMFKVYTRFSSADLSLKQLTDLKDETNPVARIRNIMGHNGRLSSREEKRVVYELQTLDNNYRSLMRQLIKLLRREIIKEQRKKHCEERLHALLKDNADFIECFRNLFPLFMDPHVSPMLRKALQWADESISLTFEKQGIQLYSLCQNNRCSPSHIQKINQMVENELQYRREAEYSSTYRGDDAEAGETIAYRESILKKWAQSALYINVEDSRTPKRIGHIMASVAAGAAMTFATMAALFAEKYFPRNSFYWGMLIVLAYIFKDRIKEILREIMGKLVPRIVADKVTVFRDPLNKKRAGRAKSTIHFSKDDEVPPEIFRMRNTKPNPFRSIMPPQDVIRFNRTVDFRSQQLLKNHVRLKSITEITRICVNDWLKEMDDPQETRYYLEEGKKKKIKGNRVYHIHMLVELTPVERNAEPQYFHHKLIVNKKGLVRVETL